MTLKQFLYLASGLLFAWMFYSSPLHPLIKWPLSIFFALLGTGLAFLPIEERPFDVWIKNFFRAIYRPTQFLWQKSAEPPEFFKTEPQKPVVQLPAVSARDRQKFEEYLSSLPSEDQEVDKKEKARLEEINRFFKEAQSLLRQPKKAARPTFYEPRTAFEELKEQRTREELLQEARPEESLPQMQPIVQEEIISGEAVETLGKPPLVEPAEPFAPPLKVKTEVIYKKPQKRVVEAEVAPSLPMPSTPTQPNILVGMTLTPEEEILPEVILEIQDKNGFPVRALRSNKLGQFFIATPLPVGEYQIEVEHSDYKFDIIKIKLINKVVPPIKIKAKEKLR